MRWLMRKFTGTLALGALLAVVCAACSTGPTGPIAAPGVIGEASPIVRVVTDPHGEPPKPLGEPVSFLVENRSTVAAELHAPGCLSSYERRGADAGTWQRLESLRHCEPVRQIVPPAGVALFSTPSPDEAGWYRIVVRVSTSDGGVAESVSDQFEVR